MAKGGGSKSTKKVVTSYVSLSHVRVSQNAFVTYNDSRPLRLSGRNAIEKSQLFFYVRL